MCDFRKHLRTVEAILVGLFFVQALRFLIGMIYSRTASASLVSVIDPSILDTSLKGVVDPAVVSSEIMLLGFLIGLPVLAILFGRMRWMFVVSTLLVGIGRALMVMELPPITPTASAGLVVGGGLFYLAVLITNRARLMPTMFILAFALDQIIRALGNSIDPTWTTAFFAGQLVLSALAIALVLANITILKVEDDKVSEVSPDKSLLTFWGGIALGAILFLELALLALPNAVAGRAQVDYATFVPLLIGATILPLVPAVRSHIRGMIGAFDSSARGWVWMLLIALMVVVGTRIHQIPILGQFSIGGIALLIAQFSVNMVWWWLIRPRGESERGWTGLWIVLAMLVFGLFIVGDLFTYEYAFVRNFAPPYDALNSAIPPLLRGFRNLGLGLLLLAVFLVALPMVQTSRRMPWSGGTRQETLFGLFLVIVFGAIGAIVSSAPLVIPVLGTSSLRIGTYNIHGGANEFFHHDLEEIAISIEKSGADVVMVQEIEAGRLTSFGVDQPLWLGRRLGMDVRFYGTNEGLQGLAVLSRVPIVFDDGVPLNSIGQQTGLQRVQIQIDEGAITLYNTWLGVLLDGESVEDRESEQQQQLSQIFSIIEGHIINDYNGQLGRAILGGTFNNVPNSPLIDNIKNTPFNDTFAGSNLINSATLVRTGVRARTDYLWLWEQTLASNGNGVIDSNASDHRLAFVEVLLRRDS
jgi:endonuclease/exonuclease/phosphatase family metal-dependent hydrolase